MFPSDLLPSGLRRRASSPALRILPGWGLALLAGTLFVLVRFALSPVNTRQVPAQALEAARRKLVDLELSGVIRLCDAQNREVYVDERLWQRLPESARRDAGAAMTVAMQASWVDVRAWSSGRRICRFTGTVSRKVQRQSAFAATRADRFPTDCQVPRG